jgi:hypothetical protein
MAMTCGSCGVRNVEFATICFSCRQPLGKLGAVSAPLPAREKRESPPRASARAGAGKAIAPGGALVRLLLLAALAWVFGRGLLLREKPPEPEPEPAKEAPPPPASEAAPPEPEAFVVEEQNGLRLVHFEWGVPSAGSSEAFRTGETVTGRSEIQGFGVTEDQKIDVTVALAFRDPTGKLVEPISPTVLRQPKESDTLFTSFDYAIPAGAPAGQYDLEMAVDDAVTSRSARFHRNIIVEAARSR